MIGIIKSNYYKFLREKYLYIFLALIGGYLVLSVRANTISSQKTTGIQNLILGISSNEIINGLFIIFAAMLISRDFHSGVIKNIVGRGIRREKYILGNIISISSIFIITWIAFLIISTISMSLSAGFGHLQYLNNIILSFFMTLVFMVAMITIVVVFTAMTKNAVLGLIITFFIYNINIVAGIINAIFALVGLHITISFKYIYMGYYFQTIIYNTQNTETILLGLVVAIGYVIIFSVVGGWILNKQDVK